MFKKFIGVSQNLIDRGKYRSARAMMEFLRRRTDGTGNDWIVNPAAQDAMMDLLDMQISSLVEQIEGYNKNGRRPRQSPTTTVSLFFTHLVVAWARAVELIPFFGLAA